MKTISLLLLILQALPLVAQSEKENSCNILYAPGGDAMYKVLSEEDKTAELTYSSRNYYNVYVIPEKIVLNETEYTVTSIGSNAFITNGLRKSLVIPKTITHIGENAFPKGFLEYDSGFSVYIPDWDTWYNMQFDNEFSNPLIAASYHDFISNGVKEWNQTHLYVNEQLVTEITIPESTTTIKDYLFAGICDVQSVTIPQNISSIGNYAFYGCHQLKQVSLPNSLTSIGKYSFYCCDSLKSVNNTPNTLKTIGNHSFDNCSSIQSFDLSNTQIETTGDSTFYQCCKLTDIQLPNTLKTIGKATFLGCSELKNINIPPSVSSIQQVAFKECSSLTSVTIPNTVESIDNGLFSGCTNLVSVTLPSSMTSCNLGSAFAFCENLKSTNIPIGTTSICEAFWNCKSLSCPIIIPETVTHIGGYTFSGCSSIPSITCHLSNPPSCQEWTFEGMDFTIPLYVPKGSVLKYKAATGWRNFVIIREIEEQEHDIYLNISQSYGSIQIKVDENKPYFTLRFATDNGWKVHSVTFNDEDVTAELSSDNEYTTPAITVNSHIIVTYEQTETQAISFMPLNNVTMKALPNGVEINNISKGTSCSVYTLDGISTTQVTATDDNIFIPLSSGRTYIVKAAGKTFKVAL